MCIRRKAIVVVVVSLLSVRSAAAQHGPTSHLGPVKFALEVEFSYVTSVRELDDGRLLVADRREQRITLVDPRSGQVFTIGREGRGPGEYGAVGRVVALGGDSSLFTDPESRRWFIVHGASIVATLGAHLLPNRLLGAMLSGGDRFGYALGVSGFVWSPRVPRWHETADSLLVLRVHLGTQHVDTIAGVRGRGHEGFVRLPPRGGSPGWFFAYNPLRTEEQVVLFLDGWIAIARTDPYRVEWRTLEGKWIGGAPLPFDTIKVTDREKCAALERRQPFFVRLHGCNPSQLPGWPETLPPFLTGRIPTLFAAPDGQLIITRTPTVASPGNRYDVVDRRGRLTGTFTLNTNETVIGTGASSVYTVVTDAVDLQQLRSYRWPPVRR